MAPLILRKDSKASGWVMDLFLITTPSLSDSVLYGLRPQLDSVP
jgi:hypothetical protein